MGAKVGAKVSNERCLRWHLMSYSLRCVDAVPTPPPPPMGMANDGTHDGGGAAAGLRDLVLQDQAGTSCFVGCI